MRKLILVFLLLPVFVFSQEKPSAFQQYKIFLKRDPNGCSLIDLRWHLIQYAVPNSVSNVINAGEVGIGVNIARFFIKKIHLGIYGTFQPRGLAGLLFPSSFNSNFSSDIKQNANLSSLSHNDSVTSAYFIRECASSATIGGCGRYIYGFSFYLPYRFFPMIQIYQGLENILVNNSGLPANLQMEQDWMNFNYNVRGISVSIFYPEDKTRVTGINFSLSIFLESQEVGSATIDGIELRSFVNTAFFNKFNNVYSFGIKLGVVFL
jgi:hypothetical protein